MGGGWGSCEVLMGSFLVIFFDWKPKYIHKNRPIIIIMVLTLFLCSVPIAKEVMTT